MLAIHVTDCFICIEIKVANYIALVNGKSGRSGNNKELNSDEFSCEYLSQLSKGSP